MKPVELRPLLLVCLALCFAEKELHEAMGYGQLSTEFPEGTLFGNAVEGGS